MELIPIKSDSIYILLNKNENVEHLKLQNLWTTILLEEHIYSLFTTLFNIYFIRFNYLCQINTKVARTLDEFSYEFDSGELVRTRTTPTYQILFERIDLVQIVSTYMHVQLQRTKTIRTCLHFINIRTLKMSKMDTGKLISLIYQHKCFWDQRVKNHIIIILKKFNFLLFMIINNYIIFLLQSYN